MNENAPWFARRDGTIRGPFTHEYIARCILLGRIRLNDELSQDNVKWQAVTNFPELFTDELSGLGSWEDYRQLAMARIKFDERISRRKRNQTKNSPAPRVERRKLPDRRQNGSNAGFCQYHVADEAGSVQSGVNNPGQLPLRVFLLSALLATLVAVYFSSSFR
ncbi:MAG: hypothetical protein U9P11_05735 [Pseudomonadota bacterium]|nr:hypothetical protein [Pseudomonadota bacterium]